MRSIYRHVMDADVNPLRGLPPQRKFQIMVTLSIMWTTIFCFGLGIWYLYAELVALHVLVGLGFTVTGLTFHRARRERASLAPTTYRDHPRRDGTARYDDVWGG